VSVAKILLVDDNTADVSLLRMALNEQEEEYDLEVLRSGEDALRFIEDRRTDAAEPDPCVILLDLHLPRFDGLAILQAIRQSPELAHIHVVVLSGFASPAERERIATLGAVYVQKPFQLSEFVELGARVMAICKSALPVP
jgi:CheY-like chemotaxis protein